MTPVQLTVNAKALQLQVEPHRLLVEVLRADGSVLPRQSAKGGWFAAGGSEQIRPGDTIVVPLDVERIRPITLWTNVSQIIYQLAIGAASAKAVGVF